jgi:hypothetical protein
MKKFYLIVITGLVMTTSTQAQGILNKINKAVSKDSGSSILGGLGKSLPKKSGASLSNDEIISGLKEALTIGAGNSTKTLGAADGFFANAAVKILMPAEAKKVESTLRKFGMSSLVDKAILSMNRAAEDAASGVTSIFWDAIKNMTVTDGLNILRGGDFAATDYLKKGTTSQLTEKMRPVIEASLAKTNATSYWKDVFNAYNKFSKEPVNTDLAAYVTTRSMEGIFYSIGLEEQKIRKDPAAQVTGLLKKVFGN